jgi:hypothetical protein
MTIASPNPAVPPPPPPPPASPPPPAVARAHGRRAVGTPRSAHGLPVRRRWGRFAAGACLALLGGWVFAALYLSAGARVSVLVAADDIGAYETLDEDDLRIERVAADPGVVTVPGGDLSEMVGRVTATAVPAGTVLAPDHVFAAGERLVSASEAEVGAALEPGQAPVDLRAGAEVEVGVQPEQSSDSGSVSVPGWLLEVGPIDDQTGERNVTLVVPRSSAVDVGIAAADQRVVLTVVGRG